MTKVLERQATSKVGVGLLSLALLLLLPGRAGATMTISPSPSYDGAYVVTWNDSTSFRTISFDLMGSDGTALGMGGTKTKSFSGKAPGTYTYWLDAYSNADGSFLYSTAPVSVQVALPLQALPGAITGPSRSASGSFTLTWSAPQTPATWRYELYENGGSTPVYSGTATSAALSARPAGVNSYRVRACTILGCSIPSAAFLVSVGDYLSVGVPDKPVTAPQVPPLQNVGAIPGGPSADGGAAGYHLEVEVPPGRAGMQPEVSLSYSSRAGNGVAGVGWSLSPSSAIYRCPKTLELDGASIPVQMALDDRLCMDGQRLVSDPASGYFHGYPNAWYRTEIEQFSRIKLLAANMNSPLSRFEVETKPGRVLRYEARPASGSLPPARWVLVGERDPQGNCIRYDYAPYGTARAGVDAEWVLSDIAYTGTWSATTESCVLPVAARHVKLSYGSRPDNRTTYAVGRGTTLSARLETISTLVGGAPVRTYGLTWVTGATGRSLLQSIQATAADGLQLKPTTFIYQSTLPGLSDQSRPENVAPVQIGDLDGDGTRESLYFNGQLASQITLSSTGQMLFVDGAIGNLLYSGRSSASQITDNVDLTGDGRADFLGQELSALKVGHVARAGTVWGLEWGESVVIPSELCAPSASCAGRFITADFADHDGDGILDLGLTDTTTGKARIYRRTGASPLALGSQVGAVPPAAPPTTGLSLVTRRDFNGDGAADFYSSDDQLSFSQGFGVPPTALQSLDAGLGGPGGLWRTIPRRRWIDVNGDGLPDIHDPDWNNLWINKGGGRYQRTSFTRVAVTYPASGILGSIYAKSAMVLDVDGDGRDELVVPESRDPAYKYCMAALEGARKAFICGQDFERTPGYSLAQDMSGFFWNALRFVEQPDGSYQVVDLGRVFTAPLANQVADVNGDGFPDVTFTITDDSDGSYFPFPAGLATGYHVAVNGALPELMVSATNGNGAAAAFAHQPLSRKALQGCPQSGSAPFYVANQDQPLPAGHVHFTSSMWAVSRMDQTNGLAVTATNPTGTNRTCYRYEDAMLHTRGRGFLGFRKIMAEEQLAPAAGEVAAGALSANNRRYTSVFEQVFPFTNRPTRSTVEIMATGAVLSDTNTWWTAAPSTAPGAWVLGTAATEERQFDPAMGVRLSDPPSLLPGEAARVTTLVDARDPDSGEVAGSCTYAWDAMPGSTPSLSRVSRTFWSDWLGLPATETTATDIHNGALPDLNGISRTMVVGSQGNWGRSCPAMESTTTRKKISSVTAWNPAGSNGARKPSCQKTIGGDAALTPCVPSPNLVAAEVQTDFSYDGYGNPVSKTVRARDVLDSSGTKSLAMTTTFGASADGYFIETEQNSLGHVSRATFAPATGKPLTQQAIQGGPWTTLTYDGLGRLYASKTDGGQAIYQVLSPAANYQVCGPANVACGLATTFLTTVQAGTPTKVEYLDSLGRVIEAQVGAFDPAKTVKTQVVYNERGVKLAEAAPRLWDPAMPDDQQQEAFWTTFSGFDELGRPTRKVSSRDGSLFGTGKGAVTATTDYVHGGDLGPLGTRIFAYAMAAGPTPVTSSPALRMSRSFDGRGRLLKTTQRDEATSITTTYAYGASGVLERITDTQGNVIVATYDDLGRKKTLLDPDRGLWTFTWDGLGRLVRQVDARGIATLQEHDPIGRPLLRFTQQGSGPKVLDASWIYDEAGRLGTLSRTSDGNGLFNRSFEYDELLRPYRVTTSILANDVNKAGVMRIFVSEVGYDASFGWVKAKRLPSNLFSTGEVLAIDRDSQGFVLGETQLLAGYARGKQYRLVKEMTRLGQVSHQVLGNCVEEGTQFDLSSGLAVVVVARRPAEVTALPSALGSCAPATGLIRQADYAFDHFLNLDQATQNLPGTPTLNVESKENYVYDGLHRLTQATLSLRLANEEPALQRFMAAAVSQPPPITTEPVIESRTYSYDDLGNLMSKSDYATQYAYGSAAGPAGQRGPHAVVGVWMAGGSSTSFTYDANGNLVSGSAFDASGKPIAADTRTLEFDGLNRMVRVTSNGTQTQFAYGPDGGRFRETNGAKPGYGQRTIYSIDKDFELTVWADGLVEERSYLNGSAVVLSRQQGAGAKTREVRYLHLDRLGSLDATTSDTPGAMVTEGHGFDPFGRPRAQTWASSGDVMHSDDHGATTDRGFTGHEQLDAHFLTHMNGRVYDYRLGRFLSVDPIISNPANPQSINPYSYIGNNPLSGTDPTGYACQSVTGSHICGESTSSAELSVTTNRAFDGAHKMGGSDEVVGMKWTTTWKNADGSTGTYTRIEMYGGGVSGAGATLANINPVDHLGPRDVSAGRQTNWGSFAKGLVIGVFNAFLPGTSRLGLPSGLAGDPDAVAGQGIGQLATGLVQGKVAADMTVGGAVGGVLTSETGVGALAGAGVSAGGLVLGGVAATNVGEGFQTLGRAMEMRGSGNGGGQAQFPSSDQLAKQLGVESRQFHQEIKPQIVRDFAAEAKSIGARNPDIGVNQQGNIVLRNPATGAQVQTTVPLSSYGAR